MKSNNWKKENVVIMHSDYDDSWSVKTIPLTYLQAVKFVVAKHWENAMNQGEVKIVNISAVPSFTISQI